MHLPLLQKRLIYIIKEENELNSKPMQDLNKDTPKNPDRLRGLKIAQTDWETINDKTKPINYLVPDFEKRERFNPR